MPTKFHNLCLYLYQILYLYLCLTDKHSVLACPGGRCEISCAGAAFEPGRHKGVCSCANHLLVDFTQKEIGNIRKASDSVEQYGMNYAR
jgi:hypothetical protein